MFNTLFFVFVLLLGLPFPVTPIQISWAAFGTNNIPGGLIAIGFLRPSKIKNFRSDVLDYIFTIGATGAVGSTLMYLCAYHYSGLESARHAVTLFLILYGMTIIWQVMGIDVLRPRTMLTNWRGLIVPPLLTIPVLLLATRLPGIFDFKMPPVSITLLMLLIGTLCIVVSSVGLRNRGLLHRFYSLFQP